MKLVKAKVKYYRNILNSTNLEIQNDVTCLVGKNESGKTAFLEALRHLNPAQGDPQLKTLQHYPAWLEKKHRLQGQDLESVRVISVWFTLEQCDKEILCSQLGNGVFNSKKIKVSRSYGGTRYYTYKTNEQQAIINLIHETKLQEDLPSDLSSLETFTELQEKVDELLQSENEQERESADELKTAMKDYLNGNENFTQLVINELSSLIPKFFYFAEYSKLPGIVKIRRILKSSDDDLTNGEMTAKSLLMQAGAENEYLLNPDYETRKRELENLANAITEDVLKYWTTNERLRVEIDISKEIVNYESVVLDELHIRMRDDRHSLSLPFEERSSGFQWFFSFLSAFLKYEYSNEPVVILLDEPGIGLHARAQADFLRFIDERLAQRCQVIYTTHSPFMIQPGKLERVRVVEDHGRDYGAVISSDVLSTDADTLFPLQGALGYDLAQQLFIGPDNLVVEGPSDYIYLSVLSSCLARVYRVRGQFKAGRSCSTSARIL